MSNPDQPQPQPAEQVPILFVSGSVRWAGRIPREKVTELLVLLSQCAVEQVEKAAAQPPQPPDGAGQERTK